MKEYREYVDAQHAPQELVEGTLMRIQEAAADSSVRLDEIPEQKTAGIYKNSHGRMTKRGIVLTAAGLAACLLIFIGLYGSRPRLSYNMVSDVRLRSGLPEGYSKELTLEEYEDYLGIDLTGMLEEYEQQGSRIHADYDETQQSIRKDEGTFYLNVEDHIVIMKVSKSGLELPGTLQSGEASSINGVTVYAGEDAVTGQLLAVFRLGEVECSFVSQDMSKRQFERVLKQMLEVKE